MRRRCSRQVWLNLSWRGCRLAHKQISKARACQQARQTRMHVLDQPTSAAGPCMALQAHMHRLGQAAAQHRFTARGYTPQPPASAHRW